MQETFLRRAMEWHGDAVYRLALCRLRNAADAEDAFQETFLRLLGKEDAESWTEEHLRAWLLRVAASRCADLGRRRNREKTLSLEEIPELPAQAIQDGREIWEAVMALPEKYRVVAHLFYAEGYRTGEIAHILKIPAATVRSRLHRARKQLKEMLGGYADEKRISELDVAHSRAGGFEGTGTASRAKN